MLTLLVQQVYTIFEPLQNNSQFSRNISKEDLALEYYSGAGTKIPKFGLPYTYSEIQPRK